MMWTVIRFGIVLASVCSPAGLHAAGAGSDSKSTPATSNYVVAGQVMAEVIKVDADKKAPTVTMKVHNFHVTRSRGRARVTDNPITVTLPFANEVLVRTPETPRKPPSSDGTPQFYTPDELRKLKGNSRYPGYEKALDDLKPGMKVEVHLMRDPQLHAPKPEDFRIDYVMLPKEKHGATR